MLLFANANFVKSAHEPEQFIRDRGSEVAFAGRSNSGKSSAINAILNRRGLARTSKTPGRTQLINFFDVGDQLRVVDLPGYGYARVPRKVQEHWGNLMDSYFTDRRSLKGLILMMDIRLPLTAFDERMLAWAGASWCPTHVLLTKADKLSRGAGAQTLQKVRKRLDKNYTVQLFSATKKLGLDEAQQRLAEMLGAEAPARGSRGGKREAGSGK